MSFSLLDMLLRFSSFNESIHHLHPSSNDSYISSYISCYISGRSSLIYTTFMITNIFFQLPLCTSILYHALQQWQQRTSISSAAAMSHSDCISYHMAIMELSGVFGNIVCCSGVYKVDIRMISMGSFVFSICWYGQIYFHILTCVERYLAVVHPIIYLSLKNERGIRIRNISIVCVWLLSIVDLVCLIMNMFVITDLCLLTLALTVISYCSISVLRVLIHPGPGKQGKDRKTTDQSKQRAFYTIVIILGVLVVKFAFNIVWEVLYLSGRGSNCLILTCLSWSNVPSSLVLPLLCLHRAGKLMCCMNNNQKKG